MINYINYVIIIISLLQKNTVVQHVQLMRD